MLHLARHALAAPVASAAASVISARLPAHLQPVLAEDYSPGALYMLSPESWALLAVVAERMHQALVASANSTVADADACAALGIPPHMLPFVRRSGEAGEQPAIGRMDWALDGLSVTRASSGPAGDTGHAETVYASAVPRLLEYNCDTYGLLVETAVLTPALLDTGAYGGEGRGGRLHCGGHDLVHAIRGAIQGSLRADAPELLLVHHPGDRNIVEVARVIESIVNGEDLLLSAGESSSAAAPNPAAAVGGDSTGGAARAGGAAAPTPAPFPMRCVRVEYPDIPAAPAASHGAVMKIFRWETALARTPSLFPQVATLLTAAHSAGVRILEPAIAYVMHNKALLAAVYEAAALAHEEGRGDGTTDSSAAGAAAVAADAHPHGSSSGDLVHFIPAARAAADIPMVERRERARAAATAAVGTGALRTASALDAAAVCSPWPAPGTAAEWIWKAPHGVAAQEVAILSDCSFASAHAAHAPDAGDSRVAALGSGTAAGLIDPGHTLPSLSPSAALEERGGVVQQFLPLRGLPVGQPGGLPIVPILSTWIVNGRCVAAIVREDTHIVTRDQVDAAVGVAVGDLAAF